MLMPACRPRRRGSMLLTLLSLIALALAALPSIAIPPSEITRKVMPSVVLVTAENDKGEMLAQGSSFVVAEGVIATNLHVIRGASKAFVRIVNNQTQLKVLGIVAENQEWDLVLLAVKDLRASPLPLGDGTALMVGDDVYAVGNPHGLEGTFSAGIVSSIRRTKGDALLQITAPISPGSGGPIVNTEAQVVGVAVASLAEGQNLNFAISSSHLGPMVGKRSDPQPLHGLDADAAGSGESKDSENATEIGWSPQIVEWVRARAQEGDAMAMFALGKMYRTGRGVAEDEREAVKWYRKAADLGVAAAMTISA